MQCKCFSCEERYPGCHGKCDDYKKWKEWLEEQKSLRYHAIKDPAGKVLMDNTRKRHEGWRKRWKG